MEELSGLSLEGNSTENAGTSSESLVQEEDGSPAADVSSALGSVLMSVVDFKRMICSVLHLEGETPLVEDKERDEAEEPDQQGEDVLWNLSLMFQLMYTGLFPLYQDYCLQDIKDSVQKLSKSFVSGLLVPEYLQKQEGCSSACSHVPSPQSEPVLPVTSPQPVGVALCALWRDLKGVKWSDVLGHLTPRQIRHQESIFELIGTEASYLRSLQVAVNLFSMSEPLRQTLSPMEHHVLFSNIRHVMAASEKFLLDLEARLEGDVFVSEVGDIVLRHCPKFQSLYVPYVTNMMYQEALVNQLMSQNRDFLRIIKRLESNAVCQRKSLKSFLVLPFQRITRIKLVLESILKQTEPDCHSVLNLKTAIESIHQIVTECDNGVLKMKRIEELIYLEQQLDFGKVKAIPLVVSRRFLVRQGPMKQVEVEDVHNSRPSFNAVYLHLFNDLLIVSSKSRHQRFTVLDHATFPTHVRLEQLKTSVLDLPPDSFLLHLTQSHTGKPTAMILVAESSSEKETWMNLLSS